MGYLHVLCGDGKGKTSAAVGMAVRAAGAGLRVYMVQLMKGAESSEVGVLRSIDGITVDRLSRDYGFSWSMYGWEREQVTGENNNLLLRAVQHVENGDVDMLILDEFCGAYSEGLLDTELADKLVLLVAKGCERVITGRNPAEKFVEAADYVSDIQCIKHAYEVGVTPRKGIEF